MKKKHREMKNRISILLLVIGVVAIFLISVSTGRYKIGIMDIIKVILGQQDGISKNIISILLHARIPRATAALLVGMALSGSGAAYQSLFQNPMASPDILGATSGAACGAAVAILLSFTNFGVQMTAFGTGILAVAITYHVSKIVGKGKSTMIYMILIGMVVSSLFTSIVSIVKYFADVDNQLPEITFWLLGGLSSVTNAEVKVVAPIILIGIAALYYARWKLNLISFGDEEAMAMGVDTVKTRFFFIVLSTMVSSAAISICGLVGWVGVIIPHCARMMVGADYKKMFPVSILLGGVFMMLMDDIARDLFPVEIPLGILTALIGAPFFIMLLFRSDLLKA